MADSVIQADFTPASLEFALGRLYSSKFQEMMKRDYYTPYRGGNVSEKIIKVISNYRNGISTRKGFYDGVKR